MKLDIYVGLPSSGKSTKALSMKTKDNIIVNRDNIRLAQYGTYWGPPIDEGHVTKLEKQAIISAFENGYDVISDNTNLNQKNVQKLVDIAAQFQAEVHYTYFDISPATAIRYDENRGAKKVGAKVINRMAKKAGIDSNGNIPRHGCYYHKIKPYVQDTKLPEAILVDLDGTLAIKSDRSPYDYSRVFEDTVNENVEDFVSSWWLTDDQNRHVIFLSGRNSECRSQTIEWLQKKAFYDVDTIWNQHLFMRPENDPSTPDFIVKDRLFEQHIAGKYNVVGVLDDRRQVVQAWRSKGLTVLDVAGHKF